MSNVCFYVLVVCFTFQTNSPANKWIFVEGWPSWRCCCDDFPVQKKLFWNKKNALIVFPKPWSCIQMSYLFPFCCFVLTGIAKEFRALLATSGNQTLYFPKLREQENIHIKAQQHEAARQARLNKKLEKMTPVEDFSDCCTRYSTSCACRIFTLLFLIQLTLEAQKVLVLLLWSGNA